MRLKLKFLVILGLVTIISKDSKCQTETTESTIEWSTTISNNTSEEIHEITSTPIETIETSITDTTEGELSSVTSELTSESTSNEIETTLIGSTTTTTTPKGPENTRSRLGLIVGATLGAIILLISLIAVAYFLYTKCVINSSSVMPSSGVIRSDLTSHT